MYLLFLQKYEPEVNEEDGEKPRVKEWLYCKMNNITLGLVIHEVIHVKNFTF